MGSLDLWETRPMTFSNELLHFQQKEARSVTRTSFRRVWVLCVPGGTQAFSYVIQVIEEYDRKEYD